MITKIKDIYFKYKEIINYLFFGGVTTIINLAVKYLLLFTVCDASNALHLQITVVISWISAVVFAYFVNRKFVFESDNENKLKEFINFTISRIITLFIEMFVMWFFITLLKLNSDLYVIIFTLLAQLFVIVGNYVFSKLFVFKKSNSDKKME